VDRAVEMVDRVREDHIMHERWPVSVKISIKFLSGNKSFTMNYPPAPAPANDDSNILYSLAEAWTQSEPAQCWTDDKVKIIVQEIKMTASFGAGSSSRGGG